MDIISLILYQLITWGPLALILFALNRAEKYRQEALINQRLAIATEEEQKLQIQQEEVDNPNIVALKIEELKTIANNKLRQSNAINLTISILVFSLFLIQFLLGLNLTRSEQTYFGSFDSTFALIISLLSILALILYTPKIRTLLARWMPIDSKNPIHTFSLVFSFMIFLQLFFTLGIGLEELIPEEQPSTLQTIVDLWTQNLFFASIAFFGVGWLTRRNWKELCERLGLKAPTLKWMIIGLLSGVVMACFASFFQLAWEYLQLPVHPEVEKVTEQSLGSLYHSVFGILTLGLAAALGEELIFRGALLPRFGLFYTSLLFTFMHANYAFSNATLVVFILSIVLALLRQKYNTTVTMITHATYNISLALISMFLSLING